MEITAPTESERRIDVTEGASSVLRAYNAICAKNAKIPRREPNAFRLKADLAREAYAIYAKDIIARPEVLNMPIRAALDTDTLGTLAGTLVIQRTLELFRLQYPLIGRVFTDFSDEPGVFNQAVSTRIVSKPAVQTYSETLGADGRPQGWTTASAATTTDANVTMDEHVGIPIVFGSNALAGTLRKLFDEFAPAASYAFTAYFVAKIYALITSANFNSYAAINGAKVPIAYATFPCGLADMSRGKISDLNAIFNPNEVPIHDRSILLNSPYHAQVSKDPSLTTFFAGQQSPGIITDNELPSMSKFIPIEAPDFPSSNNRVGFAFQRSALIAKARPSNDYTVAMPGASYGNVVTVTDPSFGISLLFVQYVNHVGGYAESRLEGLIGAAVGDKRGGLVVTSQ